MLQRATHIEKTGDADGPGRGPVKVGIVTTSYHAAERHVWLYYHLVHARVDHIFVDVEDTSDHAKILDGLDATLKGRVTLWQADSNASMDHNYFKQMHRQGVAATRAMAAAAGLGLGWLFHIDDDELLYTRGGVPVGEAIRRMGLPSDVDAIQVPNAEAVYGARESATCFSSARVMNTHLRTFNVYVNGKAAGRVGAGARALRAWGVHSWRYARSPARCNATELKARGLVCSTGVPCKKLRLGLPMSEKQLPTLMVLHYESCSVDRWIDKFWRERNVSDSKLEKLPFVFYRESVKRMKMCTTISRTHTAPGGTEHGCDRAALAEFWLKWKTRANPKFKMQHLLPIRIPWNRIYRAV